MSKPRTQPPQTTVDAVLVAHDRTCCVCHDSARGVQLHHIDGDPTNHDPANIAALCHDCHDQAEVRGGLSRRLTAGQIREYRKMWLAEVAHRRRTAGAIPAPAGHMNIGPIIGRAVVFRGVREVRSAGYDLGIEGQADEPDE